MTYNTCRLCKNDDLNRELFRYGIRHYCHAECGFQRWGNGRIPYRLILSEPERRALASKLCPLIASSMETVESPIARKLLAPTQEDNPQVCAACRKGECEDCYGDCSCPHTPAG
jgi:hypothetical protein